MPVAVITGAGAGVGRATVEEFARHGYDIGLLSRDAARVEQAAGEIRERHGVNALPIPTDVADATAVERAADRVEAELGPIDVWVNVAMATVFSPVSKLTPAEIERGTQVTYLGQVYGMTAALSRMWTRNRGTIFAATKSPLAAEVLARIRELCAVEAEIRGHPIEYRRMIRHNRSRPIVDALHVWLHDHAGRVSAASDSAKAIRCAIRHWPGLLVFLDDGRVKMDINVVERAIRPIALTRKNALFAGSDGGARHWAMAMTLIQTAKLNAIDPMAWLTDVLERVVCGQTKAPDLHTLLPWNWKALQITLDTPLAA